MLIVDNLDVGVLQYVRPRTLNQIPIEPPHRQAIKGVLLR